MRSARRWLAALAAVVLIFPYFNRIGGSEIPLRTLLEGWNIAGLFGLFLTVGLLAGGYPALYLSALKPLNVLKNSSGHRKETGREKFRNTLTVFQLGVTIVLVVSAVVIQKQLLFIKNRDIGYKRENVLAVRTWGGESRNNPQAIKKELLKNPQIFSAAIANTVPLSVTEANNIEVETETGEKVELDMVTTYFIDEDYIPLFNMEMAAGRNFSREYLSNIENQVIINETAARMAGLRNPIGKRVFKWGRTMEIIGVVKDFHFTSFKNRIEPLMFSYDPARSNLFFIRVAGFQIGQTLRYIDTAFRHLFTSYVEGSQTTFTQAVAFISKV